MRKRRAPMRRTARRVLRPLLIVLLFAVKGSMASAGCCSDAVPAPADFPWDRVQPAQVRVGQGESIQSAIERVASGGEVRIQAGDYKGSLVIGKAVSLVAEQAGTVQLSAKEAAKPCISINAKGKVSIRGLLIVAPAELTRACIEVSAREFELRDSAVIGSPGADAVAIQKGVAHIENNYIAKAKTGILLRASDAGQHTVFGNDIDGNADGLSVASGANAAARKNLIHRNTGRGIVSDNGGGRYEENVMDENGRAGIELNNWGVLSSDYGLSSGASPYAVSHPAGGPPQQSFVGLTFTANMVRHSQYGVVARSLYAGAPRPYFDRNCIYDNTSGVDGAQFIALAKGANYIRERPRMGGWRLKRQCEAREQTHKESVWWSMRMIMSWASRWQELGLRRAPVWLSASAP